MSKAVLEKGQSYQVAAKVSQSQKESNSSNYHTTATIVKTPAEARYSKTRFRLYLLACGYVRTLLTNRNVNPSDIAQIVAKFVSPDWKFDYCYDYDNRGSKIVKK